MCIVANQWFGDHERAKATAIMATALPIGMLSAFVLSGIYGREIATKTKGEDTETADATIRSEVYQMLFVQNCLITALFVYFLLAFTRGKPPTPPSPVATRRRESISQGMCEDLKNLFSNRNYNLALIAYILIFWEYQGLGVVLAAFF